LLSSNLCTYYTIAIIGATQINTRVVFLNDINKSIMVAALSTDAKRRVGHADLLRMRPRTACGGSSTTPFRIVYLLKLLSAILPSKKCPIQPNFHPNQVIS
jgi:hypothetical protein